MTDLSPSAQADLLATYLDAIYAVDDGERSVYLEIGKNHASVLRAPVNGRVHALMTACNPRSVRLSHTDNSQRMEQLRARLRALDVDCSSALGSSPDGAWQEPSFYLRDVDIALVDALATEFEQNASVLVEGDGAVVLRIHRIDWHEQVGDDPRWQWPLQHAA